MRERKVFLDLKKLLENSELPVAVFKKGDIVFKSQGFKSIEKCFGLDSGYFVSAFRELFERENVENLFKEFDFEDKNCRQKFFFYAFKTGQYAVIVGFNITYKEELLESVIDRSGRIVSALNSLPFAVFRKRIGGDFDYKNLETDVLLIDFDYPFSKTEDYFFRTKKGVNFRKIPHLPGNTFIEICRLAGVENEFLEGVIVNDGLFDSFFGKLLFENKFFKTLASDFPMGVVVADENSGLPVFVNGKAEDLLGKRLLSRIEKSGVFESGVLFDSQTSDIIRESLLVEGFAGISGYRISKKKVFDFRFFKFANYTAVIFYEIRYTDDKMAYRQFRTMFEYASDAIFLLRDYVFVECNKKAAELFRCPKEKLLGKTPYDFSPPFQPNGMPSFEATLKLVDNASLSGSEVFEWRHKRCDGTMFDAEVTLSKFQIGGYTYTQAIVRDITDRKGFVNFGELFETFLRKKNPCLVLNSGFEIVAQNGNFGDRIEKIRENFIELFNGSFSEEGEPLFEGNVIEDRERGLSIEIFNVKNNKFFVVEVLGGFK